MQKTVVTADLLVHSFVPFEKATPNTTYTDNVARLSRRDLSLLAFTIVLCNRQSRHHGVVELLLWLGESPTSDRGGKYCVFTHA